MRLQLMITSDNRLPMLKDNNHQRWDRIMTSHRTAVRLIVASSLIVAFVSTVADATTAIKQAELKNDRYRVRLADVTSIEVTEKQAGSWRFFPVFTVLYSANDPKLALRPSDSVHGYNCPTWVVTETELNSKQELAPTERRATQGGDGFDERIIEGDTQGRTADLFHAGSMAIIAAVSAVIDSQHIVWTFPDHPSFILKANLTVPEDTEPVLEFTLAPKRSGYYSVGYTGAPAFELSRLDEIWQPMFWQEKRFPERSYLALAFRCSVPSVLINKAGTSIGVVADPAEFPYQPLPTRYNNLFGVAVRNAAGLAQPMVFAPVLGGPNSKMAAGDNLSFRMRLFLTKDNCASAFETIARKTYGFKDYRKNSICSLNQTLDNEIDYGLSEYSRFNESLKGCSYATDVPGAVKNVSSLHPLEMALVTDDEEIFRKRAYPILEYMLSREQFLFCLDPKQKIQNPSRAMKGPAAPITELTALYEISQKATPVFRRLAQDQFGRGRIANLPTTESRRDWKNAIALYRITQEKRLLEEAIAGADAYISRRIDTPQTDFSDPDSGSFWFAFAPNWIDLLNLYELTGNTRYLDAAWKGARQYAMFVWMCPRIPDGDILVNEGGKAPLYWYLAGKGHRQLSIPEEMVPAWRPSAIGLVAEGLSTSTGHRGVFMAHHAPWMLRLGYYKNDKFLQDIARSAVIGRSCNFPGYHINTARTTAYEKPDYPLREHEELSVNSFHYNHIWPHMALLLDYLITDAFVRSKGQIDFPSQFIEGYAYLIDKFYGHKPGTFYDDKDVYLWMPRKMLKTGSIELNYIAARGNNRLHIALMNQSNEQVTTELILNPGVIGLDIGKTYKAALWRENTPANTTTLSNGSLNVIVQPMGITAVTIEGIMIKPKFQHKIQSLRESDAWKNDYASIDFAGAKAMILNMGSGLTTAYVYLQETDETLKQAKLNYSVGDRWQSQTDDEYPFEFTVPLDAEVDSFDFYIEGLKLNGAVQRSEIIKLQAL